MSKEEKQPGVTKEDRLIKMLEAKEKAGMERTGRWAAMWQQSLRYFFSSQLHGKRKHKDWDWVVVNYIWPTAIQEIAKLSKNYPKIITSGWDDRDTDVAETWQSILQFNWEKGLHEHGMRIEQLRAILDGKLFGYRVSKILWDEKPRGSWDDVNKEWSGDVRHRLWHPAEFWASDNEYINEGDCGTVRYVTLDYAVNKWPKFKDKLKDEAVTYREKTAAGWMGDNIRGQLESGGTYPSAGLGGQDRGVESDTGTNQLLDLILSSDKMSGDMENKDQEFVKLCETYFFDYETTDEKIEEDEKPEILAASGILRMENNIPVDMRTNKPFREKDWPKVTVREWEQPKFPNGRYIIRVGKTILNPDEVDQVYPYRQWPFVVTPHYLLPHMWQGTDAVQLYKTAQDMINKTVTQIANNLQQFGSPQYVLEKGAIDVPPGRTKKAARIGRGPGSIIRLALGGLKRFMRLDPPSMSPAAMAMFTIITQEFKNLSGLQSVAKGEKQPGKQTATEATMLSISANDRIQLQSVFEDEWIKQVCNLAAQICQKNYTIGRMVRIVGEDRIKGVVEINQRIKDVRFDVDIEPGQTLPYDEEKRVAKYQMAYEMMQNPVANPMLPEMLRVLEISGWQKLLQKYEAWQVYFAFYQLQEQVRAGQIAPEQAVQMLLQKAVGTFAQIAPQEEENAVRQNEGK